MLIESSKGHIESRISSGQLALKDRAATDSSAASLKNTEKTPLPGKEAAMEVHKDGDELPHGTRP